MYKILVLEDDFSSLMLIIEILEKYKYKVIPVSDGLEALSVAQKEVPDLAIVDIMLPTLNGYQVCERLHSIPQFKNLPVIMLTALNEEQHRIRAAQAGAVDFLCKPFKRVELLTKIKTLLDMQKENSFNIPFDLFYPAFLQALAHRHPDFRTKTLRCAFFAERLGTALGLSANEMVELRHGILLRDVGYLSMDHVSVDMEYNDERHPILGAEITASFNRPVINTIVRFHHYNLQSPDYPENLPDDLARLLRIAIVCTRFDFLTDCCKTIYPGKTEQELLLSEKESGFLPAEEVELLLWLSRFF